MPSNNQSDYTSPETEARKASDKNYLKALNAIETGDWSATEEFNQSLPVTNHEQAIRRLCGSLEAIDRDALAKAQLARSQAIMNGERFKLKKAQQQEMAVVKAALRDVGSKALAEAKKLDCSDSHAFEFTNLAEWAFDAHENGLSDEEQAEFLKLIQ